MNYRLIPAEPETVMVVTVVTDETLSMEAGTGADPAVAVTTTMAVRAMVVNMLFIMAYPLFKAAGLSRLLMYQV